MAKRKVIAGNRKRAFKIRSTEVPDAVHTIMEFVYDMCLELGICPSCKLRVLHRKGKRVFNRCEPCLRYVRDYNRSRAEQERRAA